jgi:ParB family chromosome partitioning protein
MNKILARSVVDVPLLDVIVSKLNTRAYYNEEELEGLVESVSSVGQIFPVVVRPINETKYELIIGTRRLKAAEERQLDTIPAFVIDKDVSDQELTILALSENLHRQDLTPFEEAKAILKLTKDFNMDLGQVSKKIGKDRSFIRGRLKILSLPEEVQVMICKKEGVTLNYVDVLGALKKPSDQIRYAKLVAKERLSKEDLVMLIHEKFGERRGRRSGPYGKYNRTPKSMSLKLKRLRKFLKERVAPMLEPGQPGVAVLTKELALMRKTINELLASEREKV